MDTTSEIVSVETPESVAFAYELAGLGSRGIAFGIDMLVLAGIMLAEVIVVGGVFFIVYVVTRSNPIATIGPWLLALVVLLVFVTYWGYFVFGEVARGGRTYGKRKLGIRVLRDDGARVRLADSLIRNFLRLVDSLPGNYAIGIAAILVSRKQKRVGDFVAGTLVIRDTGELTLLSDGGETAERDSLAREFLRRRGELTPEARYHAGVSILAAFGEQPGTWDEPTIAGRLAQLTGWQG